MSSTNNFQMLEGAKMSLLNNRQLARCIAIILIIMAGSPLASQADVMTGQQWLEKMKETSPSKDRALAMLLAASVLIEWDSKSHCKPQGATAGQAAAIAKKYLKENPELWHYDAASLIGAALGIVWPCEKPREGK